MTKRPRTGLPKPRHTLPPSSIRASLDRGPTIDLALGQPSWDLPKVARKALGAVTRAAYPSHQGDEDLRRKILEVESVVGQRALDPGRVLVTTGAMGALYALTRAYLGPDDVALVPNPGFPAYSQLTEWAGARAVPYRLALEDGYRLDPDAIEDGLQKHPNTRLVFICHPSNPTGAGASPEALMRVVELCTDHRALVVADEVQRHLHPPKEPTPPSLHEIAPGWSNVVSVSSVSKSWGGPGLRIGWMIAVPSVVNTCQKIHAWTVTSAPGPSQRAALALLENSATILPQARQQLDRRWQTLRRAWPAGEEKPRRPDGGFYLWFRLPWAGQDDPRAYCLGIREQTGVAIAPGIAFGSEGKSWARICFGAHPEDLTLGIERLIRAEVIGVGEALQRGKSA